MPVAEALAEADRLRRDGRLDAAREIAAACAAAPGWQAASVHLLALVEADAGDLDALLGHAVAAAAAEPVPAALFANLAVALSRLGAAPPAACAGLRAAPSPAAGRQALLELLLALDRADLAAVLAARSGDAGLLHAAGQALNDRAAFAGGRLLLERAHAARPDDPAIRRSLGLARLRDGETAGGLALYEARWQLDGFAAVDRRFPFPRWQGEPIAGRRLLVWAEQGVGDQIMQARVLSTLRETAELAVECDPRLVPLLRRIAPAASFHAQTIGLPPDLTARRFDRHGSLLSAWRWALPDAFAAPTPAYLEADPARVAALRRARGLGDGRLHVGLSWRSAQAVRGPARSIAPALLAPLLGLPGVRFHALQYDTDAREVAAITAATGADLAFPADPDPRADLDGLAALMAGLDAVVTVDNTTVHLAGALGRPTLLLLNHRHDWRWQAGGPATPLYASVEILRQATPGLWSDVVLRAAGGIAAQAARKRGA